MSSSTARPPSPPHTPPLPPSSPSSAPPPQHQHSPPLTSTPSSKRASTASPTLSPAAEEIIAIFRRTFAQSPDSHAEIVVHRNVSYGGLVSALEYLRSHDCETWQYLAHRLRWEWDPKTESLCFRMSPSPFHESVCTQLEREIEKCVRHAIENAPRLTADEREKALALWNSDIRSIRSADVRHGPDRQGEGSAVLPRGGKSSPDTSWTFRGANTPSFVLEVAWTEDVDHLREKCLDYVVDTSGNVRTAMGIKSTYTSKQDLSTPDTCVLLVRRYYETNADGAMEYGPTLWGPKNIATEHTWRLHLIDFVPWATAYKEPHLQHWSDKIDIEIPHATFRAIIEDANRLRRPVAREKTPEPFAAAVRGRLKRPRSEDADGETEEEQPDHRSLPSTATPSFESVAHAEDPAYCPSASTRAAAATLPAPPETRSKRTRTAQDRAEEEKQEDEVRVE